MKKSVLLKLFILLLVAVSFFKCGSDDDPNQCPCAQVDDVTSSSVVSGEEANIVIGSVKDKPVSSVKIFLDQDELVTEKSLPVNFKWSSKGERVGRRNFSAEITYEDGVKEDLQFHILITSDIEPQVYGFKIIKEYPHDEGAYTQGLLIHDGELYESTGQHGESNIRKVDLATGTVLYQRNLDAKYFGEGIALFDDQFFHLSWQSHRGWIYSKDSFQLVKEFTYPVEGWGITSDSVKLMMSDGSNTIYFMNPKTLAKTGKIQVYAKDQTITNINELEYINGDLYANIWQTDEIVIIDPESGKVKGRIDLTDLFADHDQEDNVLNGIAWDADQEKLYVTGKRWGKLFEIELVEK